MARKPIVAGNWKMHKSIAEAKEFALAVNHDLKEVTDAEMVICAPFTALSALKQAFADHIQLGAQNMHFAEEGAFTGEISPRMLTEIGVDYVIVGHSERRAYFNETDETVNKKVLAAFEHYLTPIVCVGEDLAQRESGATFTLVEGQTITALAGLSAEQAARTVIAYEPLWAIGTGKSSSAAGANEVIAHIRNTVADVFGEQTANSIRILYGGSVKPDNIDEYMQQPDIDGALVGGASLAPDAYGALVRGAIK